MKTGKLVRQETSDEGTFGRLYLDSGFTCHTGELPWRNNAPGISCIPVGIYKAHQFNSPKHGLCMLLEDVPGRSDVELHPANWMGDKTTGRMCQLLGCIAPGMDLGILSGQKAMLQSRIAMEHLLSHMGGFPLQLTIVDMNP